MFDIKKLQEIVLNFSSDISFNLTDWERVLENTSQYVTIYSSRSVINYYINYLSEYNSQDLSFVVYKSKIPVAIFPLFIYKKEGKWELTSNASSIIEPIFIDAINKKVKTKIEKLIIDIFKSITQELNVEKLQLTNMSIINTSNWYLLWLEQANNEFITHHLYVDLSLPIEKIKVNFSKSHKTLINKSMNEWNIKVCTKDDEFIDDIFKEFRLLHLEVSGRVTRSLESWKSQLQQIKHDEAFLVTVRDDFNVLIGAGLFNYNKIMGIYSVAAYKRELFDKPIAHGVIMESIIFLKEKKCQWYEVGQRHYGIDRIKPTEKELSISHFKEGFSTHRLVRPNIIIDVK